MAVVVGFNLALALRLLGATPAFALPRLGGFFTLHWLGVAVIIASGLALLLAYPAKALTNGLFFIKLVALGLGLALAWFLQRRIFACEKPAWTQTTQRLLALLSVALWLLVVGTGRFLAYTNDILLASRFY